MNLTIMDFIPKTLLKYDQTNKLQSIPCVDMTVLSLDPVWQGMLGGHWQLWTGFIFD